MFNIRLALSLLVCLETSVLDMIEELDDEVSDDLYQGRVIIVFLAAESDCDLALRDILERMIARSHGSPDLRCYFAWRHLHQSHHQSFRVDVSPTAIHLREGMEIERCCDAVEIVELAREILKK